MKAKLFWIQIWWYQTFFSLAEPAHRAETEQRQGVTVFFLIGPILFWYYKEIFVSSNLNSKQLRFHCAHPNVYTKMTTIVREIVPRIVNHKIATKTPQIVLQIVHQIVT